MNQLRYNRVLNFGHRGASGLAPENTLAAFRLAVELGADGVECDVQLSRDGAAVVCHGDDVDRTTDGHGRLRDFTLAELKRLDAGRWFDERFAGERIPTLHELIAALGKETLLNLELKTDARRPEGLEEQVAAAVRVNDLYDRLIVSSFNRSALRRLHSIDPQIDLGLLYWHAHPRFPRGIGPALGLPCHSLHPEHSMVDEEYMRWARRRGFRVLVWTVNGADDMRRLAGLGVDGIITNRPDVWRDEQGRS